jgi:hypothetical protein
MSVEYKLQAVNEVVYNKLNKELDILCHNMEKLFQIAQKKTHFINGSKI